MKLQATISAIALSLLFMVVYSTTNYLASLRTDVGTWYYQWEMSIPFVPIMILPYMSVDLFFFGAPYLCRDREELSIFNKRITATILIAGAVFYFYPLKLAFVREPVDGWLGWIFNPFLQMDKPYNLLPSLHIALRTILAHLYARKTTGWLHLVVQIWFSLIGFSTMLLHQHQIVDVIGGFALALYMLYFIHPDSTRLPVTNNRRIGAYYALGTIPVTLLTLYTLREGVAFFWIVIALAIAALAYFGVGPGIYRKRNGRIPPSARFALGPVLVGQRISLLYYQRQCRPWDQIAPGVLIGRHLNDRLAREAVASGVTAVLDLTAEFSEAKPFLLVKYQNIQVLDLTAPTQEQLAAMADFIQQESKTGTVYVHCKIGYSRSAAAIGAFLLKSGRVKTVEEACQQLRTARPNIVIRPEIHTALATFAERHAANHS
jgi:membrane-associated phospholipid phosphatase